MEHHAYVVNVDGEARPNAPAEVAAVHWLAPTEIADHDDVPEYVAGYVEHIEEYRATNSA